MPAFSVAVLTGRVALTKTYRNTSKEPYPFVFNVKSSTKTISSIEQLTDLIKHAASQGACLLKGELDKELDWESRSGHHLTDKDTLWVCFDIDHLPSIATIEDFLQKVTATDVSYILQWSCSYGVYGKTDLRAHIFMLLDKPHSPADLKLWLKQLNLQLFANDLTLNRHDTQLSWSLDISTCQNDKLLFVAPPICHPSSLNKFQGERIVLVKKGTDYLTLPTARLSITQLRTLEEAKINELRKAKGLDPRKFAFKELKGTEYLSKPDQATIRVYKEDGEFVRLNLNDGDSGAYYHLKGKPEIIYNFKGEPNYKTQELDPDYYYRTINAAKHVVANKHKGKLFLGFRDYRTSVFYNGWYDQDTDSIDVARANSAKDVKDFLISHGQPAPDAIPTWSIVYDPMAGPIDLTKQQVNFFTKSRYMREAESRQTHQPFPRIDALFRHVVGPSCIDHWYNWLAFIYQKRVAPTTAWLWHGTQGTGKGLAFNAVLSPIFGSGNVTSRRMEQLEDMFNGHLENCLINFVDEVQISDSKHRKMIMSTIKNLITEPTINIRRMYVNPYDVVNYVGWIMASNMPDPIVLTSNDRRFNIAEFQSAVLPAPSPADITALEAELIDFAVFLRLYQVNEAQVREVMKNDDREQIIHLSQDAGDALAVEIRAGDIAALWAHLPTGNFLSTENKAQEAYYNYRTLLFDLIKSERNRITRDELHVLFSYAVGNVHSEPRRFVSYLRHHNIAIGEIGNLRVGGVMTKGIVVAWKEPKAWFDARRIEIQQIEQAALPTLKVVK